MDFIDLKSQQKRIRDKVLKRFEAVLDHGGYVMGKEMLELESILATYTGTKHCISCSSGTDALLMPLMAMGVGPGDGVLVPAFTFFATAEVVSLVGATPIFMDVNPDTFNIDKQSILNAISDAKTRFPNLKIKGMIPVNLFGLCADYDVINKIAKDHNLFVLEDAAQSFGATFNGRKSCSLAPVSATSFFPAKPLGCYGDGGAIFCESDEMEATLKSIRVHGQGIDKYQNVRLGINGRLDTLQAAVLIEKMQIFDDEIQARQVVAKRYNDGLGNVVSTPKIPDGYLSAWAQYTIKTSTPAVVINHLKSKSIPTMVYYTIPLHLQEAFKELGYKPGDLPNCEALSRQVLSLPMHPYLSEADQNFIIEQVRASL